MWRQNLIGKQKSIRYYFAFSQKPRKLIGNKRYRNNCEKGNRRGYA